MSRHWKSLRTSASAPILASFRASSLASFGCTSRNISQLVAEGRARSPCCRACFGVRNGRATASRVLAAVCARNPAAMIGFTTAGQLWTYRRMTDPRIHVLVPHGRSPEMEGVVVHRCRRIDPVDIVQRADGIRLTSPPRTLFDSADMIGAEATASVLEQILNERLGHIRHHHRHSATAVSPAAVQGPQRCSPSSGHDQPGERRCSPTSKSRYWTRCRGRAFRCPPPSLRCDFAGLRP